jgi:hypothetical protein
MTKTKEKMAMMPSGKTAAIGKMTNFPCLRFDTVANVLFPNK